MLSPKPRANLSSRLVAVRKRNGGVRPIACGSVLRRLAAEAPCDVSMRKSRPRAGHTNTLLEKPGGCEVMHK
eukprot:5941087-Pyramimonas_sp.AAC.1